MGGLFRKDFVWGCATAAYQVEGAAECDGRGPSVWDRFCRKGHAVWQDNTGDAACDHYHRYREDVALMKELGLRGYRFSISWPRVLPEGTGKVNAKGLSFYDRLVDELLAARIEPFATLFHWDYPYALYCRGGWLNRDSAEWFGEYAALMARKLGDRVKFWMTHNEPQCTIGLGHQQGIHAPGDKLGVREWLRAGHHLLLSHGRAVQALRARAKVRPKVGYAPVGCLRLPASNSPRDVKAARRATFAVTAKDAWNSSWWMDPVFFGRYPEDGLKLFGADAPEVRPGDLKLISQPLDFFGVNLYSASRVRAGKDGRPEAAPARIGPPLTAFHWEVTPEILYYGPKFYHERYGLPIYVTENGMAGCDWVSLDGKVRDPQRIDYLHRYFREFARAAADGVDARGCFVWSLMDNFEWAEGYKQRFGLIHVNYETQARTPKDSFYWYKEVIAANGENLLPP